MLKRIEHSPAGPWDQCKLAEAKILEAAASCVARRYMRRPPQTHHTADQAVIECEYHESCSIEFANEDTKNETEATPFGVNDVSIP